MKLLLFVVMACIGITPVARATVSCNPKITFLGFAEAANQLYYSTLIAGDCSPAKILYQMDLANKKTQAVLTVEEKEGVDWDNDYTGSAYLRKIFKLKMKRWFDEHNITLSKHAHQSFPKPCKLGQPLMAEEKERGMDPSPQRIKLAYYHNIPKALWVVISAHHYAANSCSAYPPGKCPTIDYLSVYPAAGCQP